MMDPLGAHHFGQSSTANAAVRSHASARQSLQIVTTHLAVRPERPPSVSHLYRRAGQRSGKFRENLGKNNGLYEGRAGALHLFRFLLKSLIASRICGERPAGTARRVADRPLQLFRQAVDTLPLARCGPTGAPSHPSAKVETKSLITIG
jgi:hypothetical protein